MRLPEAKRYPLIYFAVFLLAGLFMAGFFLREVKRAENILLSEWARVRYLSYLLETEAPPPPKRISAERLKEELLSRGLSPEVIKDTTLGVEMELEVSWRELSRLLSLFGEKDLRVVSLKAEDPSGEGNFRVRVVVK